MIVITNANTSFSRLIVQRVLARVPASQVAVTARQPQELADLAGAGVDVRREDFTDPDTTAQALAGADRVLTNPPPGWNRRETTGADIAAAQACVEAAIAAKVPRIVHVGIINNDRTDLLWHNALDGAIRSSGIAYTILRDNLHTEALLPAVRLALAAGEFVCSFGGRTTAPASRADYAEAAAIALTADGHENGVHELSGFGLTALGMASVISALADREIRLREVDLAEVAPALRSAGASDEVAADLEDLYAATSRGEFAPETDSLDRLLGHPHLLNEEALRRALNTG